MGLGPSWVFTAQEEQRDRQSAVAEGNARRQAASTSPCHTMLSGFFLLGREKGKIMRSETTYPLGGMLSGQSPHQLPLEHPRQALCFPLYR